MLLIVPIAAFFIMKWAFNKTGVEWRESVMIAATLWGTCLLAITEILSWFRLLSKWPLVVAWLGVCLLAILARKLSSVRNGTNSVKSESSLDSETRWLLVAAAVLVLVVGCIAVSVAPNVWDAMEYHLPRVSMWIGNHSVHFYETPDYAQLIFGPWAEFAMMHAELLWGSDRFVNMIEFASLIFSAIAVSVIAGKLGARSRGQALAAIVAITIPQGLLEASGPMNTYVVACWIATTLMFLLLWNENTGWVNAICIGAAAGLAICTKGTAYVVLPFLVAGCWLGGNKHARIQFLKYSPLIVLVILSINGSHYGRNIKLTGSPLGFPLPSRYPRLQTVVGKITPRETLAEILRNASIHVVTPSERVNAAIDSGFHVAIRKIGVNPDDPAQIYLKDPFHSNHFSLHEVHAGNPLHFLLITISIGIVLWKALKAGDSRAGWYAAGIMLSLIMFSAMIRWTEWSSRYQLPYFIVGAPLVALVLDRYASKRQSTAVATVLLIVAIPFAFSNRIRSLISWSKVENVYHPRSMQYFLDSHNAIAAANIEAAKFVNQLPCNRIAIDSYLENPVLALTPRSMYVYPMIAMIHGDGGSRLVWYTGVQNDTTRFRDDRKPCAVVCFECRNVSMKWEEYSKVGGRASVFDYIVVFSDRGEVSNRGPNIANR